MFWFKGEPFYKSTVGAAMSIRKKGQTLGSVDPIKFIIKEKKYFETRKKSRHKCTNFNLNFYKHILDDGEDEQD